MTRIPIALEDYNTTSLSLIFKNNPLKILLVRPDDTVYYVCGIYFNSQNKPYFVKVFSDVKTHTRSPTAIELAADDKFYIETN